MRGADCGLSAATHSAVLTRSVVVAAGAGTPYLRMRNVRRKVGVAGAQSLLLRLVFVFLFHFSGFWNERLESEEAKGHQESRKHEVAPQSKPLVCFKA